MTARYSSRQGHGRPGRPDDQPVHRASPEFRGFPDEAQADPEEESWAVSAFRSDSVLQNTVKAVFHVLAGPRSRRRGLTDETKRKVND